MERIEKAQTEPGFWDNPEKAQKEIAELKRARASVDPIDAVLKALGECDTCLELIELDEDGSAELEEEFEKQVEVAEKGLEKVEFQVMLGGTNDHRNAYVTIQAGAGGVDACDWAAILLRMYNRWAEDADFKVELIDEQDEPEGGIRSATIRIIGPYAYGYLKAEMGVHRLVRISPFDAQARRQTSFASVDAMPEFDEEVEIEINWEKDVRMDTYRAGGAGGQHVNVTNSACRLTHIPTGVVAACQNERSFHKNRAVAEKMLKAKLYQLEVAKREKELAQMYGDKGEIAWGNQIRSYVMHPYQMVKDHRTNVERGNIQAVLDGDLDEFIVEYLRSRKKAV